MQLQNLSETEDPLNKFGVNQAHLRDWNQAAKFLNQMRKYNGCKPNHSSITFTESQSTRIRSEKPTTHLAMCFCFYRLQCQIFDAECTECIWEMRWENEDKDEKKKTQIVNEAEMFKKKSQGKS